MDAITLDALGMGQADNNDKITNDALSDPNEQQMNNAYQNQITTVTGDKDAEYTPEKDKTFSYNMKQAALKGLNVVADSLDYLNNVTRSMIHAWVTDQDIGKAAGEAAQYKRRIYSEDIRREVGKKLGINILFSQKQGEFDMGDIADFAADVAIDTLTDPLTFISLGATKAIKSVARRAEPALIAKGQQELAEKVTTRLAQTGGIVKKGKRGTIKIKPRLPQEATKRIEIGKDLGLVDEIEINKVATSIANEAQKSFGVQVSKDAYTGLMGGLYNVAANVEDESNLTDVAKNFSIGALTLAGARRASQIPWFKENIGKIGRGLNDAVSPNEVVKAMAYDADGNLQKIATTTKGWQMGDIALDAAVPVRSAAIRIHNVLRTAHDSIVKGDAVKAAINLEYLNKFDDFMSDLRNEMFDRAVRNTDEKKLADYGITIKRQTLKDPITGQKAIRKNYPRWSEVSGPKAQAFKDIIHQDINNKYFTKVIDKNGKQINKLNPAMMQTWLTNVDPDIHERIIGNLQIWKNAADEAFEIEKKMRDKELQKLISPDELYSDVMKTRSEAIVKARTEGITVGDALEYSNVKNAMDMNIEQTGMPFWYARHGEKTFAGTQQVAVKATKMANLPRQRAALSKEIEQSSRDFLAKDKLEKFQNNRTIETAKEFITASEQLLDISAKTKARRIMNTLQTEASVYEGEVLLNAKPIYSYMRRVNSLVKKGLLLGGYTWIKNNFWSNTRAAFSKHGVFGLVDQAKILNITSDLSKDLRQIYFAKGGGKTNLAIKFSSDEIDDMIERGVLDAAHWQDITKRTQGEELRKYILTPEAAEKIKEVEESAVWLSRAEKAADKMSELLKTKQLGGYIEGLARATTYQRTLNLLKDSSYDRLKDAFGKDVALEAIKKQATNITNDVFFDYSKLTFFERSVARELIPFYSFYKQNLFYQTKALLDPDKAVNIALLTKLADGRYFGGEPITGEERDILQPHLKNGGAMLWTDKDGHRKVYFTTSDAALQAYQMLTKEYWFNDFKQQLNPILKSAIEQIGGYDFFRDEKLSPKELSDDPNRQLKYLFSRGYATQHIFNALNKVLGGEHNPIWPDANGNPVTDKEYVARIDNIITWLLASYTTAPVQMISAYEKMNKGKASGWDTMMNLAGPLSTTKLIPAQQERRMEKAMKEKYQNDNPELFERLRRTNRYVPRIGE